MYSVKVTTNLGASCPRSFFSQPTTPGMAVSGSSGPLTVRIRLWPASHLPSCSHSLVDPPLFSSLIRIILTSMKIGSTGYSVLNPCNREKIGSNKSTVQCCGSGMFIPDPNFFHPGSRIHIKVFQPQKIVSKLSEIWSGLFIPNPDPGSGSWFFFHPGSQIQGSKRHRILDPQHWLINIIDLNVIRQYRYSELWRTEPVCMGEKWVLTRIFRTLEEGKLEELRILRDLGNKLFCM